MSSEKQKLHLERLAKLKKQLHPKVKLICQNCGIEYSVYPSQLKYYGSKYCSRKCQNSSSQMKEVSRKNGERNKGKLAGDKNGNWKGGKSYLLNNIRTMSRMRLWVYDIFKRDKFTCQKCGDDKGGNLNAHHLIHLAKIIEKFNIKSVTDAYKCKELWDLDNGITLCIKCHRKEHYHYFRGHR